MAGYVDPFAHRLRGEGSREGGGGSDEVVDDEVELEIVDLTDEPVEETGGSGAAMSVV